MSVSRYLYQKCLERICRAEEDRRLKHSKTLMEPFPALSADEQVGAGEDDDDIFPSVVPIPSVHAPQPPPIELASLLLPQVKGVSSDSLVSTPKSGRRNSERIGANSLRSVAATHILSKAAFQSQQKVRRSSMRDEGESSPHCEASSNDPSDALESGLGPPMRGLSRLGSTFFPARMSISPPTVPEYPTRDPIVQEAKEGSRVLESGSDTSQTSDNGNDGADRRSKAGVLNDTNSDAESPRSTTMNKRAKMIRSHSDKFFEMAHPDSIGDVSCHQTGPQHTSASGSHGAAHRHGPENLCQKCSKKAIVVRKFSWEMCKKSFRLLRNLIFGFYEILVFGPHVAGGLKSEKGKAVKLLYLHYVYLLMILLMFNYSSVPCCD